MFLLMMLLAGLVFIAGRHGDLPVGRALHELLIARPAAWLTTARMRRLLIMLALLIFVALVWSEIAPVLAALEYRPVLWFADIALYLDAGLLTAVALVAVRARSVGRYIVARLRGGRFRLVRRPRARASSPRRPKRPPPANEDAPGYAAPIAA